MQWLPWGRLLDSVRAGKPAFPQVFGVDFYEYLLSHPDDAATFRAAMAAHQNHNQLTAACDLSSARLIVDIGGGNGRLIAALLRANPGAQGILLDKPNVVSAAGEVLRQAGVVDRCRVIGGDFFSDMPAGGNAYVFSRVIMDLQDAAAITLLRASKSAMAANGRVIIVERVIPASNAPSLAQLSDMMSLVVTGGRIRSENEFEQLFHSAGLRRESSILLPSGYTILELHPAEASS
jgi:predicted O-methyltransferase YrrM